jgi:hypothetical protein
MQVWKRMADDRECLHLCLRLDSAPGGSAYRATIELAEIELVVDSIELDLASAVRGAAGRCAEQLRVRGYDVTIGDVIGALEDALATSHVAEARASTLVN